MWLTITASNISNAPTAWDTQNNTLYHTPDANMTSLSIRLTVPLREVSIRDPLAQRTAAARASREHHVHSPCRYAIEACCSLCFVATLASHCSHRTYAKAESTRSSPCEHHHTMLQCMVRSWHARLGYQWSAARVKRESSRALPIIAAQKIFGTERPTNSLRPQWPGYWFRMNGIPDSLWGSCRRAAVVVDTAPGRRVAERSLGCRAIW